MREYDGPVRGFVYALPYLATFWVVLLIAADLIAH